MTAPVPPFTWPSPARAWFAVTALSIANLFSFLDRTVLNLLVAPIKTDLLLSDTQIGLLQGAAFGVFYTLMILPFGWVADNGNRVRLVGLGLAFWSIMTALCGLAGSFTELFVARIGVGFGEATLAAAGASIISDYFPAKSRTLPLSVLTLVASTGAGVALIAGGLVGGAALASGAITVPVFGALQPWQIVFLAVGLPGLVWAMLFLAVREPARLEVAAESATWAELFRFVSTRRKVVGLHFFGYCFYNTFGYGAAGWLPVYFMRTHGWSLTDVGLRYGAIYLIFAIVGGLAGGALAKFFLSQGRANANLLAIAVGNALLTIPAVLTTQMPSGWISLALAAPLITLLVFPSGPSLATIQEITPNRLRGRMTALYYAVTNLVGISLGALLVGALTDYVFRSEAAVGNSISLAGLVLCPTGAFIIFLAARARLVLESLELESLELEKSKA
ncbi:MAG: MFS transporter [Rhodospirillaceae bacterium]|nr:MFS transporter [Rhodospirillaceae bacterium]